MIKLIRNMRSYAFSTPQELLETLSHQVEITTLLHLYQGNKNIYRIEHVFLTFRIMTHFLNQVEKTSRSYHDIYNELSQKLNQGIDQMNAVDLTELLYFKSRFVQKGLGELVQVNEQSLTYQVKKTLEQFTLRQMINILYDSYYAGINLTFLQEFITHRVGSETLNCADIIEECLKHVDVNFVYYDMSQLGYIYNLIMKCRIWNHTHDLKMPSVIYRIRQHLLQNLIKLDEHTIIVILQSHSYYKRFQDLEMNIKDKVFRSLPRLSSPFINCFLQTLGEYCSEDECALLKEALIHNLDLSNPSESIPLINQYIMNDHYKEYVILNLNASKERALAYLRYKCNIVVDSMLRDRYNIYKKYLLSSQRETIGNEIMRLCIEQPLQSIQDISKCYSEGVEQVHELDQYLEKAYDEYFKQNIFSERQQIILFKGVVNETIRNKCNQWMSQRRNEIFKLLFRNVSYNPYQLDIMRPFLYANIEQISMAMLLNLLLTTDLLYQPSHLKHVCRVLKRYKGGVGLVLLCRQLEEKGMDYTTAFCGMDKQNIITLYDLYQNADVDVKMIILYIVFYS